MRNQEAMIRACQGGPTAHARGGAGAVEINGRVTAKSVLRASLRPMPLMAAPSQFRRLKTLAYEAIDRPCIDKFIALFAPGANLGVALGNMDGLYIKAKSQLGPFVGVTRFSTGSRYRRRYQAALFNKSGSKTGIGALSKNGCRPSALFPSKRERFFTQSIIGAKRCRNGSVGIASRPRLDAGVQIQCATTPA